VWPSSILFISRPFYNHFYFYITSSFWFCMIFQKWYLFSFCLWFREIAIFIFRKLIHRCNFTKINVFLYIFIFIFSISFSEQNLHCCLFIVDCSNNCYSHCGPNSQSILLSCWKEMISTYFCSLAPIVWCVASMFVSFYLNIVLFFVCLVIIIHIYSIFWFVPHCEYFWLQMQPYK